MGEGPVTTGEEEDMAEEQWQQPEPQGLLVATLLARRPQTMETMAVVAITVAAVTVAAITVAAITVAAMAAGMLASQQTCDDDLHKSDR